MSRLLMVASLGVLGASSFVEAALAQELAPGIEEFSEPVELVGGLPPGDPDVARNGPLVSTDELLARLSSIDGLTILGEEPLPVPGFRFLTLSFTQPIDHDDASRGSFEQRLTLLHHDFAAPMVSFTTGYELEESPFRAEPTALIDGNQIGIEERFFASSTPEPADFRDLNIYQAAADHHRIIEALKPLYGGRWISTGASKGGMATVYHRRFFDGDVDGSVVYVAPNDVADDEDLYSAFLDDVGSDPVCRDDLRRLQRKALEARAAFVPTFEEFAAYYGCSFEILGSADAAYEVAVSNVYWSFWQYALEEDCALLPTEDAYAYELISFIDALGSLLSGCDQSLVAGMTYFYQAGTELGSPSGTNGAIADLLRYPELEPPRAKVPSSISMEFDALAMQDIDAWVKESGHELLFIYGENDPWSAEPFELGAGTRDSFVYVAEGMNHGANILSLDEGAQLAAANTVRRWARLRPLEGGSARALERSVVVDRALATPLDGLEEMFRWRPL